MANIHPLATVHPGAKLAADVEVGAYAFIDDNVEIGPGCRILPHATIFSYVKVPRYLCLECGYSEEWIDPEDLPVLEEKYR